MPFPPSLLLATLSAATHLPPLVVPQRALAQQVASQLAGNAALAAPLWTAAYLFAVHAPWRRLLLASPCQRLGARSKLLPCAPRLCPSALRAPVRAEGGSSATGRDGAAEEGPSSLGGFVHVDVLTSPHLRAGPELSWSTPDSPREDLPKLRLLSPGWGLRYAWSEAQVAIGVSAASRFLMVGQDVPVFDPLTSEARVELILP